MTATLPDLVEAPRPVAASPLAAPARTVPRVNLLPAEVVGRRAVRRARRGAALAAGVTVLVLGAAGVLGAGRVSAAQDDLDTATARSTALQAQQAEYAAAPQTIAALRAAQDAQATAMAQDVRWYAYVDSLAAALPAGSWLVGLQTTATTATAATGAASTTTGATGAAATGTVTITAKSTSYDDVAAYLDELASVPGTADPYLTTATQDDSSGTPVVSFAITAQITADALSHRFDLASASTTDQQEG